MHADALNVLAQIEIDQNDKDAAIAATTKAYTLAWCDGIPADGKHCHAYHYGLTNAKKLLQQLGAPEPKCARYRFRGLNLFHLFHCIHPRKAPVSAPERSKTTHRDPEIKSHFRA